MKYPLFTPPGHLAEKGVKNWNKREAKEYAEWFHLNRNERVNGLLSFFGFETLGDHASDLHRLGELIYHKLREDSAYAEEKENGRLVLSDPGYALAADFGLLFAQLIESRFSNLSWSIGGKPKSYHAYNLPILQGFSGSNEWDFLFKSVQSFGYSLNVIKQPYDWEKFYYEIAQQASE